MPTHFLSKQDVFSNFLFSEKNNFTALLQIVEEKINVTQQYIYIYIYLNGLPGSLMSEERKI